MDFDLPVFDTKPGAEKGFELQLTNTKNGLPTEQFITVLGVDSEAYQEALRAQQRRYGERMQKAKRMALPSPEEQDANSLALLVSATIAWRGFRSKAGTDIPFSAAAATQLYNSFPEIREQVDRGISDRANFLPGDSKSSSSSPATSSN